MYYITIDCGTTNTRATLWRDGQVAAKSFVAAGVRDTAITGSKQKLQQGVRQAVAEAVCSAGVPAAAVTALIASGMITSGLGLWEVPHIQAPAGVRELAAGMIQAVIPEVSDQPVWFIPGVKNRLSDVDFDNCEAMDIMRGEEVETFGLLSSLGLEGAALFVLPGSHSKFVSVDETRRITGCLTTLAGELLSVIAGNTIIADAVKHSLSAAFDAEMVLAGARCSRRVGLGRACFTVRILDMFAGAGVDAKVNFLRGAVLGMDVQALQSTSALNFDPATPVIVAGKKELRDALYTILANDGFFTGEIRTVAAADLADVAGWGAALIARERGIIR